MMKTTLPVILLLIIMMMAIMGSLSSCQDNVTDDHSKLDQYFPNSVGDRWTYAVYDSTKQKKDTVTVSIVGKTTLSNGSHAKIWQYQWLDKVDTTYVQKEGKKILTHNGKNIANSYTVFFLQIPLSVGQKWATGASDSSHVVAIQNITVPAGTFTKAFKIKRLRGGNNFYVQERYWVKPQIGVVKLYRHEYDFAPPTIRTWQLLNYSVKD